MEVDAPLAVGAADWVANAICRSNEGVPLPQPPLELPAEPPEAGGLAAGLAPDSCLVELVSVTLVTPSTSRRRDISLATSGWLLVQPASSIEVPADSRVLVGAAAPAEVGAY